MINYKGYNVFENETDLKNVFVGKKLKEAVEIISHNDKDFVNRWCENNSSIKDLFIDSVDINHLVLITDPFYDTFFFDTLFSCGDKAIVASTIMNCLNPSKKKDENRFENFILKLKSHDKNA